MIQRQTEIKKRERERGGGGGGMADNVLLNDEQVLGQDKENKGQMVTHETYTANILNSKCEPE